jgi:CBS domain containing-hemolysin-like protein
VPVERRAGTAVATLASPALEVPESSTMVPVLAELRRSRSPLAIVVDEHGATAGLLTVEDIVEELVGEIRDEHDQAEPGVVAQPDGAYLVPGSWRPDEVARDTGVQLPEGDYETLSGLIMASLGRVPAPGDQVEVDDVTLQVVRTDGHAVGRVRLTERPP